METKTAAPYASGPAEPLAYQGKLDEGGSWQVEVNGTTCSGR